MCCHVSSEFKGAKQRLLAGVTATPGTAAAAEAAPRAAAAAEGAAAEELSDVAEARRRVVHAKQVRLRHRPARTCSATASAWHARNRPPPPGGCRRRIWPRGRSSARRQPAQRRRRRRRL